MMRLESDLCSPCFAARRRGHRAGILLFVILALCACRGQGDEGDESGLKEPKSLNNIRARASEPVSLDQMSPAVVELLRSAHAIVVSIGEDSEFDALVERASKLETAQKRQLTAGLAGGKDPGLLRLRASVLYQVGDVKEGDRAVADLIVQGFDPIGFFYGWMHDVSKSQMAARRYLGISDAVLERYRTLSKHERRYADPFLCDETYGEALEDCSLVSVEQRLEHMKGRF